VIAGLGNIYVCEALYYAGISPRRSADNVPGVRSKRLLPAIRQVLKRAIAAGGSSLNDYRQADGELGYFQHDFAVYDQSGEICPNAVANDTLKMDRHRINRITQSGRSTYYCPGCQR
jgi:formamidopyrimidine-DNA glycosylase